ncbi:hypothetical protein RJ55_02305 [Drechmeria coniospora]|nr:hypothetical protein RJ55_02305 [Drechmeria coniospora]
MPRNSFSRNPLLRVSRPVSACSRCRNAKVKCDGKLPACTACEKAGRENECSNVNDQFARGKERSYVAALESRIEKLERRLQFASSRKASVAFHEHDASAVTEVDRRDSLATIRAAIYRKAARSRENRDLNAIVSDFGLLSVDATTRDFEPSASKFTFARVVLAATTVDDIPDPTQQQLPSRQAAQALVQHFLANIYSLYPFFSETALWTVLDDVYRQDERAIIDADYWLLYMVLAIASSSQSRRIDDQMYHDGVGFVSQALLYADKALAPGCVTQIQSLLLLTLYSMLDSAHFDSWHVIGFTTRAVVDIGFHQDPPSSSLSDKAALDMRRKIFYSAYALDRTISMAHARSFSFTNDSVNVAFPSTSSIGRKSVTAPIAGPQSADPALLLFQLRRAQSFWYQELCQSKAEPLEDSSYIWQWCLEMREWGDSLPAALPAAMRRMFEQELWYSYVYCIAPSGRTREVTDYTRTLIFEYALAYLGSMHETAQGGLNSAFYTYQDALKVFFMASQLNAVLLAAEDVLLSGAHVSPPPTMPGSTPAPPIPRRRIHSGAPTDDNTARSIWCLERVPQILALYGARWKEAVMLKQHFEFVSADALDRLRARQQMQMPLPLPLQSHPGQYQNGDPALSPPIHPPVQGQQPRMDMNWAEGYPTM